MAERDRLVVMLVFAGGNLIDVAGPLQAFASANELRAKGAPGYRLMTVSEHGGAVVTAPGLPLHTEPLRTVAFLLADAGVLDGRRCTTHWSRSDELQQRRPALHMNPDAIFVRDGNIWTSGGVTAGIDLALALIEDDLGHAAAVATARQLVMFVKRPGGQSQFSAPLLQLVRARPVRG